MMKYLYYTLVVLLFASCEKDAIFTGDLPAPRLVLFSFIEPDSVIQVWVSTSRPLGHDSNYKAHGVEGEVYVNEELKGKLRHVISDQYTTDACAKAGDRIRLVVRAKGMEEASAETVIPASGPQVEIDTILSPVVSGMFFDLKIPIKITEPDREHRYYRVVVLSESTQLLKEATGKDSIGPTVTPSYSFDKKNEPILNDKSTSFPWEDEEKDRNYYNIFSNSIFRGKSYTLNLSTGYFGSYYRDIYYDNNQGKAIERQTCRHTIKLLQLNEESYLYLRSEQTSYEEGWFDPIKVYTNVHNGLGIVGAYRTYQLCYTSRPVQADPGYQEYNPFYY